MTLRLVMLQYICCCPSCGTEPPPRLPGAAPGERGSRVVPSSCGALRSCSGLDSWAESQEGPQTSPVTRRASDRLLGPLNLELPAKHQLTPHLGRLVGAEQVERRKKWVAWRGWAQWGLVKSPSTPQASGVSTGFSSISLSNEVCSHGNG